MEHSIIDKLEKGERRAENNMAAALEGIRVLDFTHALGGPFSTLLLRDLGAEVIKIEKPKQAPDILCKKGKNKRRKNSTLYTCNKVEFDSGKKKFKFDASIYGHKTVKEALIKAQNGKCCFCESKVTHIAYGDVEHFRPKAGYKQNKNDSLCRPGYYWLAYDGKKNTGGFYRTYEIAEALKKNNFMNTQSLLRVQVRFPCKSWSVKADIPIKKNYDIKVDFENWEILEEVNTRKKKFSDLKIKFEYIMNHWEEEKLKSRRNNNASP